MQLDETDTTAMHALRLNVVASESYARLAARTGADPVKLAEADVLGLLWAMRDCVADVTADGHLNWRALLQKWVAAVDAALAACRKEGT